jgi:hypothetical protein
MPTHVSGLNAQKSWSLSRFAAVVNDSNLVAVVLFCVIGLVITAVFMLRFPVLGRSSLNTINSDRVRTAIQPGSFAITRC